MIAKKKNYRIIHIIILRTILIKTFLSIKKSTLIYLFTYFKFLVRSQIKFIYF